MIRERLSQKGNSPCAMLIVDVDSLKTINDTKGHPQGDRAICRVADILKTQFRKSDIVGRIGGDEFIVFLTGVERQDKLESMASKILENMERIAFGEANELPVHVSIGIANGSGNEATFDDLYARADKALYEAKANGKNRFAFYHGDDQEKT